MSLDAWCIVYNLGGTASGQLAAEALNYLFPPVKLLYVRGRAAGTRLPGCASGGRQTGFYWSAIGGTGLSIDTNETIWTNCRDSPATGYSFGGCSPVGRWNRPL